MKYQVRKLNFWIVLLVDLLLLVAAHLLAYVIRFEGDVPMGQRANIPVFLAFLLPIKLGGFFFFGLYRGMWRYTSLADLLSLLRACVVAGFVSLGVILLVNRFEGFSRAVFVLDILLTFLFVAGFRVSLRVYYQNISGWVFFREKSADSRQRRKRLLVVGAGDAAEKVAREINDNKALPYMVAGFLDDNAAKVGQRIHGIPVLGSIAELQGFVSKTRAQEILIAIPSAGREQMQRIVDLCREGDVPFKTLPSLGELISDQVSVKAIRDVSYRDLLGRPPVRLALQEIGGILAGRTILITGAGGSVGSELCRQIVRFQPGSLILMDISEQNLYQIEMELRHEYGYSGYTAVLGKVQDKALLEALFQQYRPTVVFHAAAYKHVPMVECNPWEGVYNNIFASKRLMEVAVRYGVERFILISTDKAVRPTNVMGATKRMAEMLMQGFCEKVKDSGAGTRFMAVRFGNVLGSSGSVIPLFRRQIELGGPVTVTHPEMTRYFMSIEEASQLILQAATMGEGGEIFVLEMGTPVRIGQMARDLIQLCGKEPDTEIEIRYIGLRPGEKMYEELITEGEGIVHTGHEKIMVLRGEKGFSLADLQESLANLKQFSATHDAEGIKAELGKVIPEYTAQACESVLPRG
ncbi:MAG: nucleoside-diphosphate sugar epimerase/dehydratase [Deltaproteobacteria bacterium]|nr:nucleoside-diphosphate sugar epimerase/dehydratase [Deltaproteobacteria bacterium]